MSHPFFDVPTPVVLGHRGAAGHAPENTLASFQTGLELGASVLESDVHETRDGVPVLIHDSDVARTTDGLGAVADLSLEELRRLDAGHRFSLDGGASFPFRDQGVRIPTLEEAFEAFPRARFNLEIKYAAEGTVERVVDLVQSRSREATTLLTSGEDAIMERLRAVLAATGARSALGASLADILAVVRSAVAGTPPETDSMALQIPTEFGGRPLVTPELVAHARAHGVAIHVWTINDETEMARLLDLGVDGIVTDYPDRMQALVARRRGEA